MNTQTEVEKTGEAVQATLEIDSPYGTYAVVAHKESGEVKTLFAKSKAGMGKLLTSYGETWALLGVFRGKQLNIEKKISFSFN